MLKYTYIYKDGEKMESIKKLKNNIPIKTQWLMIGIGILFSLVETSFMSVGYNMLTALLAKLLIGLAVIYLFSEKKPLAGYIVLFIGLFIKYLYDFISFILSFQFRQNDFLKTVDIYTVIGSILSVYLLLILISYVSSIEIKEFKLKVAPLILMLGIYLYMRYGSEYAIVALFLMILLNSLDTKVTLNLVMLSYLIHIPFFLIDLIFDHIGFNLLSYWFYGVFGFVLMIWVVFDLMRSLNQENV